MRFPLTLIAGFFAFSSTALAGWVDLHAHLFFYEGVGTSLFGDFESALGAKKDSSRLGSRVNFAELDASDATVVVAALYAHPLFFHTSQRETIRVQIREAQEMCKAHPNWGIARTPEEARKLRHEGKKVLVLSIEGAAGILDAPEDFAEFIDREGVAIVTPFHFADDHFGGPALLPGMRAWVAPLGFIQSWFNPRGEEGVRANPRGLSDAGEGLIRDLMRRKVWIDLAHSSDQARSGILKLTEPAGQPLLYTHTVARKYYEAERGISQKEVQALRARPGAVGLIPSDEMVEHAPLSRDGICNCPSCHAGMAAFATEYFEFLEQLGASKLTFGTDINAPMPALNGECQTAISSYGKMRQAWELLNKISVRSKIRMDEEGFFSLWAKVRN